MRHFPNPTYEPFTASPAEDAAYEAWLDAVSATFPPRTEAEQERAADEFAAMIEAETDPVGGRWYEDAPAAA